MSINPGITTNLAAEVSTYYEKVFLDRVEYELVLKEGAQMRTHPTGGGKTINFTRYNPITGLVVPMSEASNPSVCEFTGSTVSVTLAEYGMTTITGKLLTLVSIDQNMKEKVALVGQHMGEALNHLVLTEMRNASQVATANSIAATLACLTSADVFGASCIRDIVSTLEVQKARTYPDGMYLGKLPPLAKYRLLGDSIWLNSKTYSDVKDLYRGEIGELYQVRWLLNKDIASQTGSANCAASSVVAYYTYVHGQNAIGAFDLAGDQPKLYVLANQLDSGSPAGRRTYISWAGAYAVKLLNSNWIVEGRFAG